MGDKVMASPPDFSLSEMKITILKVLESYQYKVPSFPGVSVKLRHVKYQATKNNKIVMFDGFMKDGIDLQRPFPAVAIVDVSDISSDKAWFIQEAEFMKSVTLPVSPKYPSEGVFIIWDWLWESFGSDEDTDEYYEDSELVESEGENYSELKYNADTGVVHSVTFKCIGANKDSTSQLALERASEILSANKPVRVELKPEPLNPKDSQAIAFICYLEEKPFRIGYVVHEVLEDVHDAIRNNKITSVKFEWIKYITSWTYSGPGWFAGIEITRKGRWSDIVIKSASTKH